MTFLSSQAIETPLHIGKVRDSELELTKYGLDHACTFLLAVSVEYSPHYTPPVRLSPMTSTSSTPHDDHNMIQVPETTVSLAGMFSSRYYRQHACQWAVKDCLYQSQGWSTLSSCQCFGCPGLLFPAGSMYTLDFESIAEIAP
jgi:hypothetical protein